MKLFYSIKSIRSTAEDVYVRGYGQNVFEFHKSDFDNDWQNVIDKKYELDPCVVADISKLDLYGNEAHGTNYSYKDKVNWYYFARNKIRDDFLANTTRMSEVDKDRPIELYNRDTVTNLGELTMIFSKIPTGYKIDASNLKLKDIFDTSDESGTLYCTYNGKIYYQSGYAWLNRYESITKLPQLPKNLIKTNELFNNWLSLEDISNLDFSNIMSFTSTFGDNRNLIDFSTVDLSNATEIRYFITRSNACKPIKKLPKLDNLLNLKSLTSFISGYGISTNDTPISIESIILPDDCTIQNYIFSNIRIDKINTIKVGNINNVRLLYNVGDITIDNLYIKNYYAPTSTSSVCIYNQPYNTRLKNCIIDKLDAYVTGSTSKYPFHDSNLIIDNLEIKEGTFYNATLSLKKLGNATIIAPDLSAGHINKFSLSAEEVGVINIEQSKLIIDCRGVHKSIALPIRDESTTLPTSTGFELWIDGQTNLRKDTPYVKLITIPEIDISQTIVVEDRNTNINFYIDDLIRVNPNYEHTFELEDVQISSSSPNVTFKNFNGFASSDISNISARVASFKEDSDKFYISFDLKNISDNASVDIDLPRSYNTITYKAKIDGYPFTGQFNAHIFGTLTFEVDEDITTDIQVEYDENDTIIEPEEETPEE